MIKPLHILHIVEDFSILSGGIRTVVKSLHEKLIENGQKSYILTPFAEAEDEVININLKKNTPWTFSRRIKNVLQKRYDEGKIDVIHIHGVWMYPQYCASKFAVKNDIPFVVSFHGMYEPRIWKKGFFKKKLYSSLLTNKFFKRATFIHAITSSEKSNLEGHFPSVQVLEIPNLIEFKPQETTKLRASNWQKPYILFLGRIAPIKGIELLIKAYHKLNTTKYSLVIAGPKSDYANTLKVLVKQLKLEKSVTFTGLLKGAEKDAVYNNATLFIAPSYSEVIGMVNLEAALFTLPVITTYNTGIDRRWTNNGGILINPNQQELIHAINTVLNETDTQREERGLKLKKFVYDNYSWNTRYKDWHNLYTNMV